MVNLLRRSDDSADNSVVVLGLGRFGQALALELMAAGTEVLGIDGDPDVVQSLNGRLTHVVRADTTKEEVLRQLAVPDFEFAVVGIGTNVEASILTTSLLLSFGIPNVWTKALSEAHGRILTQLGVGHVIYPEADMGRRVAHLVCGAVLDYIPFEDDFAMIKTRPPAEIIGRRLGDTGLRGRHDVTIVAVHRRGQGFSHAHGDTVVQADDMIIVAGKTKVAERFSRITGAQSRRVQS